MTLAQAVHQHARDYHEQRTIRACNHFTKRLFRVTLPGDRAIGLLFNFTSVWIGMHYSKRDRRFCLNLIPCLTVWWTRQGGETP